MTPVVYVLCQTSSLANGGLESMTQILGGMRSPRVVVTDRESRFTERWRDLGCEVHVWPIPDDDSPFVRLTTRAARAATLVAYNARIAQLLRATGARVLHANDIRAFWFSALGARAVGARVVFAVRDVNHVSRSYGPKWKVTHHLASEIVCLSNEMRDTALERFPPLFPGARGLAHLSVVYSAVDLARMQPLGADARAALRREIRVPDGAFEIAYVGVFSPKKNQLEFLRRVVPAVTARLPRAHFTFAGDFRPESDAYAKECEGAARDLVRAGQVRFAGFDPAPERYYQAADILALASQYEGLPRCMIESLACGTPVVAFDVTSVREFLEKRDCGVAIHRDDYTGMVAAIVRLAEDPALRARMAETAREVAVASFAPELGVAAYAAHYERLGGGG